MSLMQNLRIRTKVLSLVLPTCLIGIGGALYVSSNFKSADTEYSDFIANDGNAEIDMAIASAWSQSFMTHIRSFFTTLVQRE